MIGENYLKLVKEVRGRALIVCVSKGRSVEEIYEAYEAGGRDFGESYVNEALEKREKLPRDIRWHFIGKLQSNKVRKVVGKFVLIHSVDSVKLLQKVESVSEEMGVKTSVLLEVKSSIEKLGLTIEEWKNKRDAITSLKSVEVKGVMTMAPQKEEEIAPCFQKLRSFRDEINPSLELSMGMSNDYQIALKEGATILRIGSLIFNAA